MNLQQLAQKVLGLPNALIGAIQNAMPVTTTSWTRPQQAQAQTLPQATPTPQNNVLSEQAIQQGMEKFNPDTPLASQSGVLHQAMQLLADNHIDPSIALTLALRETRGGLDLLSPDRQLGGKQGGVSNVYNMMPGGKLVNYPDLKTAILGGDNALEGHTSQGLVNTIINSPAYAKFRQTGNLDDLNAVYAPPGANRSPQELSAEMNNMKNKYFAQ